MFFFCLPFLVLFSARLLYESICSERYMLYCMFFGHTEILLVIIFSWLLCGVSSYFGLKSSKSVKYFQRSMLFDDIFNLNVFGAVTIALEILAFFASLFLPFFAMPNNILTFLLLFISPLLLFLISVLNFIFFPKTKLFFFSLLAGMLYAISGILISSSVVLILNKV